ncbi:hypothetical protein NKI72_34190 [Mesorhizobium sp. M0437]|uniref:hypothetical protein n=1 Tax=Mesorhizobium sp. M0437 TaxID=2956945 RepID=UPI00333A4A4E
MTTKKMFLLCSHGARTNVTPGKATRHNKLGKAECSCGNVPYCRSADLMMVVASIH